jgi:hypothetical protein
MRLRFIPILGILAFAACDSGKSLAQNEKGRTVIKPQFTAGPPTLVYKTRKDYTNHVPVLLSGDKTKIVSYPDPKDFSNLEKYPLPILLSKGYLLDERGIGLNVAYLSLTYKEYAALEKAPSLAEMMNMIIDKDPLTELCNCGNRQTFTHVEAQLNDLINSGNLKRSCKVIK